jgi:putative flippase GtrA
MRKVTLAFARFLLVGGFATAVQYVILYLLVSFARMHVVVASTIGYALSAACNYILNYRFTFNSTQAHRISAPRFVVICVCGLALNSGMMILATGYFKLDYMLAQLAATAATLAWNFVANGIWSFRSKSLKLPLHD